MKHLSLTALLLAALVSSCSSTKSSVTPMTPDEVQAAMIAYSTPGPQHKLLDPMVGTFQVKMRHRMGADQPWTESTGTCTNRWIYDGRFLEIRFQGSVEDMTFEGQGLTGFDNSSKEFVGFWTDSWSTGLAPISHGTADASGKVITQRREMRDPINGKWTKMRDVTTILGPKSHRLDSYSQPDGESEFHMMTIEFTR